jgi:hypothetical protein
MAEKNAENNEEKEFAHYWKMRNDELARAEEMEKEEEKERNAEL